MQAVCWCGKGDVRVERVPDPQIRWIEAESGAIAIRLLP